MTIDLAPRRDATLEWWFLHGVLEGATFSRCAFMVSAFRKAQHGLDDAWMLLVNTTDLDTGMHACRSEVTPAFAEHFLDEVEGEREGLEALHQRAVDAYAHEVRAHGIPAPFTTQADARLTDDPFLLTWGDIRFATDGARIELTFALPKDGRTCTLQAVPQAPWVESADMLASTRGTLKLHSCPRLALSGDVDGEAVSGDGWFDHQWGDYHWFASHKGDKRIVGWLWLGANLDDGSDLIAWQRIDMKTGATESPGAILCRPGEAPRQTDAIQLEATRHWVSPGSMMRYPLAWQVTVPDFDIKLTFAPVCDGQELPVFGLSNTVWEGAGRVEGTRDGADVSGRARLELQGYGYLLDFDAYRDRWVERLDTRIKAFLPERIDDECLVQWAGPARWGYDADAQTEMLARPAWDLLARGGKHWRPIYCHLLADVLGVDMRPFEELVATVPELIHNGSVIIDDVEDDSATRRGDEAVHRRYGTPTAINLGNTLYFLPLLTLLEHEHLTVAQREEILALTNRMFVRSHLGQAQDLYWAGTANEHDEAFWLDDEVGERILQAHALKSASAVRALSEVACVIGGVKADVRAACARFGETWGTAFQVVDDAKNFSDRKAWGKQRGEDIAAGKVTYATWNAVRMLEGADRAQLIQILRTKACRGSPEGLARGVELVEQSGALDACREKACAMVEADWHAFNDVVAPSTSKIGFRMFITSVLDLPLDM